MTNSRSTNKPLCALFIGLGLFFIFLGIVGAVLFIPLAERKKEDEMKLRAERIGFQNSGTKIELQTVEMNLEGVNKRIKFIEEIGEIDKKTDTKKKSSKIDSAETEKQKRQAAELEALKTQREELTARKRELTSKISQRQQQAVEESGGWFEDYNLGFLLALIPVVFLALMLMPMILGGKLPQRNPLSLTDAERRSVLFVAAGIAIGALALALPLWFVSIT